MKSKILSLFFVMGLLACGIHAQAANDMKATKQAASEKQGNLGFDPLQIVASYICPILTGYAGAPGCTAACQNISTSGPDWPSLSCCLKDPKVQTAVTNALAKIPGLSVSLFCTSCGVLTCSQSKPYADLCGAICCTFPNVTLPTNCLATQGGSCSSKAFQCPTTKK